MFMQYKDSMDVETVDMSRYERERAQLIADQAKSELEIQSLQRKREQTALWAVGATAFLLIFLVLGVYSRYRYMHKTNKIISSERDRSEELLLNILPKETAQELKDNGNVLAKRFESVTVLFTDFKGFTAHAESMDPEKLVESIDFYFSNFDRIVEKHGLEKIKTVGDAYMCAGGLPFPSEDHAHRVAEAALELTEFVEQAKTKAPDGIIHFDIRVGINSGPVVAGVVGTKKFAYDIWGDTVNIASRMESASDIGKINIAQGTYELIRDDFEFEYRGKAEVKNRGRLNMYFLLGKKARSKTA
jgi:class 3 adenylate cyclase